MNFFTKLLALLILSFLCASQSQAQRNSDVDQKQADILSDVPQKIDTKARYLFYLHGYIVQAGNIRPTSPKFGVYEYEKILEAISKIVSGVLSSAFRRLLHDEIAC